MILPHQFGSRSTVCVPMWTVHPLLSIPDVLCLGVVALVVFSCMSEFIAVDNCCFFTDLQAVVRAWLNTAKSKTSIFLVEQQAFRE